MTGAQRSILRILAGRPMGWFSYRDVVDGIHATTTHHVTYETFLVLERAGLVRAKSGERQITSGVQITVAGAQALEGAIAR